MSRALKSEQKETISTLVSQKELLAVLPTGFWKNLIFQGLVLIKRNHDGKPSSVVVVCPPQVFAYDQTE